ncbi:unnamed protein product [Rotaria sp. Silwood2]|nr:unnamed protein product [Rotaria sp. Silwood2]CAF4166220.1 unnamed protein product [Rotaria sp. Silwood2]
MGGRNISTTKSGKFMNPTDQARKEARKKELKKNKKQRLLVRQNVLKGKNPRSLISEMEHLDRMEYDPVNPAPYNIKVLQEKRKKVKETWDRVYRLYSKDQPESITQMDSLLAEYERGRAQLITWFESVKETQRVTVDEIPMPELPSGSIASEVNSIPTSFHDAPRSILKQKDSLEQTQRIVITKKPPGPPPGRPPILSDNEDISDDEEEIPSTSKPLQQNERRRIRFADASPTSVSTTASVSRWSDNIPTEEAEFGTPVAASEPPQYTTERPLIMPPPFPPPPRGMRLPPPPPPVAFFAANPSVRMPPNVRPSFPPNAPPSKFSHQQAPNVFSAPPSLIAKPSQTSVPSNLAPVSTKPSMTFEAKPQIRARQDVTKFVPTVLKVKRGGTANSTGIKITDKTSGIQSTSRFEDPLSMKGRIGNTSGMTNQHLMMAGPSTDDAYDTFMKEINQLI